MEMLIATRSAGKLRELRPLFAARGIDVIDLSSAGIAESGAEDDLEAFDSFEANALAKARYFARLSGRATFADDSGLVVDALNGMPGVLSKRWSGRVDLSGQALDDENNRLLLERLRTVAASRGMPDVDGDVPVAGDSAGGARGSVRAAVARASYVCAAAFVDGTREIVRRGEVYGHITEAARGAEGFGYDPYFFSDELGRTFGEATREAKEVVSHRGRAFRALLATI